MRALGILAITLALVASSACTRDVVRVVEVPKIVVVEEEVVVEKPTIVVVEKEVQVEKPTIVVIEKEVPVVVGTVTKKREVPEERPVHTCGPRRNPFGGARSSAMDSAAEMKIIHWRASSAVTKLSPFTAVSDYVGLVGTHIFSSLVQPNPHEQMYAPDLAARWEVAPDGTSATFYLQENPASMTASP